VLGERPRASNHRASFAVLLGLVAVLVVPGAIVVARQLPSVRLIDASWGIPVAVALGFLAVGLSNLAGVRVQWTVGRAGGEGRARLARRLGTLAICIAVTASISVGVYELLLRLER
jgi:hypothetical protein